MFGKIKYWSAALPCLNGNHSKRSAGVGASSLVCVALALTGLVAFASAARADSLDPQIANYLAKRLVRAQLKDPDSARFSDIHGANLPSVPGTQINGWSVICGVVNSKNSFGGFAGPERFVVIITSPTDAEVNFERDVGHHNFKTIWAMCDQ